MEMIWHHLHTEPVAPSLRTERTISREVDELVLACLHKNPRRRPQDAAELSCRMAGVRSGAWNQSAARSWWEAYFPEFVDERIPCPQYSMNSRESRVEVESRESSLNE